MSAPNIIKGGKAKMPWPLPPLAIEDTGSLKLLDELAVASQWQLVAPASAARRAYRARMNEIHTELQKRLAPKEV